MPTIAAAANAIASDARRQIIELLCNGPASVSQIAAHLDVTLPAALKHVDRLVDGGLVTRVKSGRVATVSLVPGGLEPLVEWATRTRLFWTSQLDSYAAHLNADRPTEGETT